MYNPVIEKAPEEIKEKLKALEQLHFETFEDYETLKKQGKENEAATVKNALIAYSVQIYPIIDEAKAAYIRTFKDDPESVLKDVSAILDSVKLEDFEKTVKIKTALAPDDENPEEAKRDYAADMLENLIITQIIAINRGNTSEEIKNDARKQLENILNSKIKSWFPDADESPIEIVEKINPVNDISYPTDKANNIVWNPFKFDKASGCFRLITSKNKAEISAFLDVIVSWDQEDISITKSLTSFDKLVYCLCAQLYDSGNKIFTIQQLHELMNNTKSRPSKAQIKRYEDSLTKLSYARLKYTNRSEYDAGYNFPLLEYDAPLLPMCRVKAKIIGGETNIAVKLYEEPPLIAIARKRKQITSINKALLYAPLSNTENKLQLQDYLIRQINWKKNDNIKAFNITFDKIKEECNITRHFTDKTLPTINKLLEHFKKEKFIENYVVATSRITIEILSK